MNQTLEAELRGLVEGWRGESKKKKTTAAGQYVRGEINTSDYCQQIGEACECLKCASQLEAALERGGEG